MDSAMQADYGIRIYIASGSTSAGILHTPSYNITEWATGTWARVADATSVATINLPMWPGCLPRLERSAYWLGRVHLAITRGTTLVWYGVVKSILGPTAGRDIRIVAHDETYWLSRIFPPNRWTNTGTPTEIAWNTLTAALANWGGSPASVFMRDSGLIRDNTTVTEMGGDSIGYEADRGKPVREILTELSDYGMTWTSVGHQLFLGERANPESSTPSVVQLRRGDYTGELEVSVDLDDLITYALATSSDENTNPGSASITGFSDSVPNLGSVIDGGDVTSTAALNRLAARSMRWPARPVMLADNPDTIRKCLDVNKLIPGRSLWSVDATHPLWGDMTRRTVLESVEVTFTPMIDSTLCKEQIKIGLTS